MPQLLHVQHYVKDTSDPREDSIPGFKLSYTYAGVSPRAVKGRAVGRLVSKYPLKAANIDVLGVDPVEQQGGMGANTYRVDMFVPNASLGDKGTEIIERLVRNANNG